MNKKITIDPSEQQPPTTGARRYDAEDARRYEAEEARRHEADEPRPYEAEEARRYEGEEGRRYEADVRTDQPTPAAAPHQPAPAPQDVRSVEFFPPERREELKGTWLSIQSAFIDEPQRAVRNADGLVREILGSVSEKFESARRGLEAEWDKGEQASTEALRIALQRYRSLFDRLLSL